MKSFLFSLLVAGGFLTMQSALAASEPVLDQVLADIVASQNVTAASDLSCDRVTDDQYAELGEAFMALRHPDEDEHAFMDQMMGGEGSDSLRSAHIGMGQAYLGCDGYSGRGSGMMDMMGGYVSNDTGYHSAGYGMMGLPFGGMMSGFGYGASIVGWVTMLLVWLVLILGIIWLVKNINRKK